MKALLTIIAVTRSRWRWLVAGILLGVAVIATNALLMAVSGWFITSMAIAGISAVSFNYFTPSAAIRALAIARTVGRYLERLVTHAAAFQMLADLRLWLFQRLEPLSPALLERYASGELAGRLRSDIDALENLYLRMIAPLATGVVASIGAVVFVAYWHIGAALVLCVALLFSGLVLPVIVGRMAARHGKLMITLNGELRSLVTSGIGGSAELLLLGAVEMHAAQVDELSSRLIREQDRLARTSAVTTAALFLAAGCGCALLLFVMLPDLSTGVLTGPRVVMLLLFAAAVFEAVGGLPAAMQFYTATAAAAARITELASAAPPVTEPVVGNPLPAAYDLVVRRVAFSYDGYRQILHDFDLELPVGARVALTGESGCGKSTLVDILLRFREYQGTITLGGTELRTLNGSDLRRLIAALRQRPHLFNATIRENLLLARPEATPAEVAAVVHIAALDGWIAGLPEGLDTRVGEGGCTISGGEARRIALARTLLQDAPLVILDEPTEGLDAETESLVLQRLHHYLAGKSLLLITHRPAALQLVERVITLGD